MSNKFKKVRGECTHTHTHIHPRAQNEEKEEINKIGKWAFELWADVCRRRKVEKQTDIKWYYI